MPATYAVFFKTHFWDAFASRQLERLCARVGRGDVFVVLDGTFATLPVVDAAVPVIVVSMADLADLHLAPVTTHGSVIWYNPDYPNYVAAAQLPPYNFYVSVEYDVVVNTDLDRLVDRLAADGVDYLGFLLDGPVREWPWFEMHEELYGAEMLHGLSCLSVFSRRAQDVLLARRQQDCAAFATGALRYWPNNEAFIPNEIHKARLMQANLSDYGDTASYDWWPPMNEAALGEIAGQDFIHPVLPGARYIKSSLYHEPSFLALLRPGSSARARLAGFDARLVRPMVFAEVRRRIGAKFLRLAQRLGLRPAWTAGAKSGARSGEIRGGQQASAHNAG